MKSISIGENLTAKVTQASWKKAKSVVIEAVDFIELNVGGSSIKMTPSGRLPKPDRLLAAEKAVQIG
ncbi:MAG: hypothetical protein L3J88_11650 [Gammaproteobacteria bacterium]|nr:hypothetical protein [Gammaproteobacteria bacterium]MCF6363972.1 hypothetical protein [Gammaproteobacteria bacterium]